MIVIEDKHQLKFLLNGEEISHKEGFKYLNNIYGNEPQETKKIILQLKEKYYKDLCK